MLFSCILLRFTYPELAWELTPGSASILRELETVRRLANFQVSAKETDSLSPRFVSFWHDASRNPLCRYPLFPVYCPLSSALYRPSARWPGCHAQRFGPFLPQLSQRFYQSFLLDLDPRIALREIFLVIELLLMRNVS